MATNYVQPGDVRDVKLAGTTAAGALVAVGDQYAVALEGGGEDDIVSGAFSGVYTLPKKASVVIAHGEQLYLDTGELTNTVNTAPVGIAAADAVSAATTIPCQINTASAKAVLEAAAASAAALYTPL